MGGKQQALFKQRQTSHDGSRVCMGHLSIAALAGSTLPYASLREDWLAESRVVKSTTGMLLLQTFQGSVLLKACDMVTSATW